MAYRHCPWLELPGTILQAWSLEWRRHCHSKAIPAHPHLPALQLWHRCCLALPVLFGSATKRPAIVPRKPRHTAGSKQEGGHGHMRETSDTVTKENIASFEMHSRQRHGRSHRIVFMHTHGYACIQVHMQRRASLYSYAAITRAHLPSRYLAHGTECSTAQKSPTNLLGAECSSSSSPLPSLPVSL